VSFIPLNEISTQSCVTPEHSAKISEVTQGGAKLAIDLIDYDPKLKKAMMFLFGTWFVADT
jgi:chromosome segregation ATPase